MGFMKEILDDASSSVAANVDGLYDYRFKVEDASDEILSGAIVKLKSRLRLIEDEVTRRAR